MKSQRVVLFTEAEAEKMRAAQRSIYIAYPQGKVEVPEQTVLRGLGRNDPIVESRLLAARTVLVSLVDACRTQSRADHWTSLPSAPAREHISMKMVQVLTTARQTQLREVLTALGIVDAALAIVADSETEDDSIVETAMENASIAAESEIAHA